VAPLHRVEVQLLAVGAAANAGGGPASQSDPHARPAQLDQQRARRQRLLVDLFGPDAAHASGDHDRLVIADALAPDVLLERPKVTCQIGTPELVVEGCRADRALEHDPAGVGDTPREAVVGLAAWPVGLRHVLIGLPRGAQAVQPEVGDAEPAQPGLRTGAAPGGGLIADLAAGAGG